MPNRMNLTRRNQDDSGESDETDDNVFDLDSLPTNNGGTVVVISSEISTAFRSNAEKANQFRAKPIGSPRRKAARRATVRITTKFPSKEVNKK